MKYIIPWIIILGILMTDSCKKELKRMVFATTDSIYHVDTVFFATGTIVDAGEGIDYYGHCWSLNAEPVIDDDTSSFVSLNQSLSFTTKLSNLVLGRTYYIRTYTRSKGQITYGNTVSFVYNKSSISIDDAYQITIDTIRVSAVLVQAAGDTVEAYGLCWTMGTSIPTKSDNHLEIVNLGEEDNIPFNAYITSFLPEQLYSVRAYAIIDAITVYSDVITIKTGSLIFWNKLGVAGSIISSEVGPSIECNSYKISDWSEADILPAKFGNGLFINHDTNEGWANDGANFFACDVSDIDLSVKSGSIEFWFIFKCSSTLNNYAYFFDFANQITNHFSSSITNDKAYLSAGWNGWEILGNKKYFFFTLGIEPLHTNITIQSSDVIQFNEGDTCHFAFVWNAEGICGSQETMQIYMNGNVIAKTTQTWDTLESVDRYMYLGAMPGYNDKDQKFNAVKGIIDNLKIYNFAKVSYSDRKKE